MHPKHSPARDAALAYAAQAAKDKRLGEILLCVGVALYVGDPSVNRHHRRFSKLVDYCPWAIDGYGTFEEAMQDVFGMKRRTAFYRATIGRALIAQYGKENVIKEAERMGIARIPSYKLRELIRAPKFFENLCMHGCARLANGNEVSVDWVLEQSVSELKKSLKQNYSKHT
ncbi:hypothetical protein ES703_22846 [subsurface metagenome]|nr:hypothetical protein [bacterium]